MKVRRSVSVKASGMGVAFLATLVLALVAAINGNNSIAILLASILLAFFVTAFVNGALNLLPLRLAQLELDNAFAGERVQVRGLLASRFPVPGASLEIVVESETGRGACSLERSHGALEFALTLPPQQRGYLQLESLEIRSSYPIGMLNWSVRFDELATTGLVYPTPIDYLADSEPSPGKVRVAAGGDFDELETWQNGDTLSGVCWKTYAKTGKRMRKRFLDSGSVSSGNGLCLDGEHLPLFSDEELRSQLCYWVVERQRRREPYGLRFRGRTIATASGTDHDRRCLETLTVA